MKRQVTIAACCLAMSVSPLLAGCAPADTKGEQAETIKSSQNADTPSTDSKQQSTVKNNYKDGTYQGEGTGMGGPIKVSLTITDGVITVDEITESGETPGVGGKEAIEDGTFKAFIEDAQSADIDTVSGATMTSGGVIKAVEAALAQAK